VAGLVALTLCGVAPGLAFDLDLKIFPVSFSPAIAKVRTQPSLVAEQPKLTEALLAAYVKRQQQLKAFDAFSVPKETALTETALLGYIAKRQNRALEAIESAEVALGPVLTEDFLSGYAREKFVPTVKRVKLTQAEELCLAQAIYHEARGESEAGQLAVANIIINRAMSKKYPSTVCGVVFQNAERGFHRCQFTFACDGKSDMGRERKAWLRSVKLADVAFREFQTGRRPGVIPNSALFYHTVAVAPKWSHTFRRVAAIGSHVFYAPL
jgi:hypothetical protein